MKKISEKDFMELAFRYWQKQRGYTGSGIKPTKVTDTQSNQTSTGTERWSALRSRQEELGILKRNTR